MCGKAQKQIEADLRATGLPWTIEPGTCHLKIRLCGYLVGILPKKGVDNVGDRRSYLNIRSQIRRKAKEISNGC